MKRSDVRYELAKRNGFLFGLLSKTFDGEGYYRTQPSENLCVFFWQMLFGVFTVYVDIITIPVTVLTFITLSTDMIPFMSEVGLIYYVFEFTAGNSFLSLSLFPGVLLGLFLTGVLFVAALISIGVAVSYIGYRAFKVLKRAEKPKERGESVIFRLLKSKKKNVCPVIQFED